MELTGNTFFFPWEVGLEQWLQSHLGTAGTGIMSFFSAFGEEIILILILLLSTLSRTTTSHSTR